MNSLIQILSHAFKISILYKILVFIEMRIYFFNQIWNIINRLGLRLITWGNKGQRSLLGWVWVGSDSHTYQNSYLLKVPVWAVKYCKQSLGPKKRKKKTIPKLIKSNLGDFFEICNITCALFIYFCNNNNISFI